MNQLYIIITLLFCLLHSQEIEPEITMERKKLIILASENKDSDISNKVTQIASSTATQLNRYDVISYMITQIESCIMILVIPGQHQLYIFSSFPFHSNA